jgi:hypothetical protein
MPPSLCVARAADAQGCVCVCVCVCVCMCVWHQNNIPVFCPALTDGSIGDMIFFRSFEKPGLRLDIVEDLRAINLLAMEAEVCERRAVGESALREVRSK